MTSRGEKRRRKQERELKRRRERALAPPKELGPRLKWSAWNAAAVAWFTLGLGLILLVGAIFSSEWTERVMARFVVVGCLTTLVFVTYFFFGALGYPIVGDDIKAPRWGVRAFLFLIFVGFMIVFGWLYATDRILHGSGAPSIEEGG